MVIYFRDWEKCISMLIHKYKRDKTKQTIFETNQSIWTTSP